jgi:hypothetical protein
MAHLFAALPLRIENGSMIARAALRVMAFPRHSRRQSERFRPELLIQRFAQIHTDQN